MLRLYSVSIKWFRGIREGGISGLTDVNVLVGRNNCGKTTVVEAILRLAPQLSGGQQDLLGRNRDGLVSDSRNESAVVVPGLWYRFDQTRPIELEVRLADGPEKRGLCYHEITVGQKKERPVYKEKGVTQPRATEFLRGVACFRPQDGRDRRIENAVWQQLLASRKDKALTKALNGVFDLGADSIHLLPNQSLMVGFEDHAVPLDSQGDGTRAALRALAVLAMLKGTLLLMEEPESHQHPASLERFAQTVCRQAGEQDVQIIISTHSIECVRAFLKGAEAAGSEASVFHLTLDDGNFESRRLDAEAVETLQGTGVDVRALDLYA
jgi:predicted ATPase